MYLIAQMTCIYLSHAHMYKPSNLYFDPIGEVVIASMVNVPSHASAVSRVTKSVPMKAVSMRVISRVSEPGENFMEGERANSFLLGRTVQPKGGGGFTPTLQIMDRGDMDLLILQQRGGHTKAKSLLWPRDPAALVAAVSYVLALSLVSPPMPKQWNWVTTQRLPRRSQSHLAKPLVRDSLMLTSTKWISLLRRSRLNRRRMF